MGRIVTARAYANNEVAYIAWSLDGPIEGCLGFDITRLYPATSEERPLAVWVPFRGQSNPAWQPQTTRVWPVQKLSWRDLTLRRRRDRAELRPDETVVQYRIRPVGRFRPGLEPVPVDAAAPPYEGRPLPLAYLDAGLTTAPVRITQRHGDIHVAFTNGILAAQWLRNSLREKGEELSERTVEAHISTPGDDIRRYLAGDVLDMLRQMILRLRQEPGSRLKLALYELWDEELVELIAAHRDRIDLILANSSRDRKTGAWDSGNALIRGLLGDLMGARKIDRMFNNGHIGHNKFAVLEDAHGRAKAVMTGSTNWTPTGLAGQSNNALVIESPEVATAFLDYWHDLAADTEGFERPEPLSAPTRNVQGERLRAENAGKRVEARLGEGTRLVLWRSPNTKARSKQAAVPPDLAEVYEIIARAREAIFFAVFLPGQSGRTSVIEEAIKAGDADPSLLVYGAVSDVMAMPNYKPPRPDGTDRGPQPAVYNKRNVHVVRAAALGKDDLVGAFESELLTVGKAVIHDKILVVDPLSEDCAVIVGSHNLGAKASYENDENLLILKGNQGLAMAYAVHVLDVYEHYRYRALQKDMSDRHQPLEQGGLYTDDSWLAAHLETPKGALARYLSGATGLARSGEPPAQRTATAGGGAAALLGRLLGRR